MNVFDQSVLKLLFAIVHWCPALDPILQYLVNDDLLKGGVIMAIFWGLWFRDKKPVCERRELLLFAFISSSTAVVLGRLLALCVPFRVRPVQNPLYNFPFPHTDPNNMPHSWNSFPSDHAILFFCLATSLWMVSRRIGVLIICQTLFVICLPRIYMGYHYPSDIAAGALLGIGAASVGKCTKVRKWAAGPAFLWMERHPASFYAFAFLWTYEVTELFRSLLNFEAFIHHGAMAFLRAHI
jgi:membrane-associated phospholipid phosphatase